MSTSGGKNKNKHASHAGHFLHLWRLDSNLICCSLQSDLLFKFESNLILGRSNKVSNQLNQCTTQMSQLNNVLHRSHNWILATIVGTLFEGNKMESNVPSLTKHQSPPPDCIQASAASPSWSRSSSSSAHTPILCVSNEHVLFKALACQMDGGRGSHGQSAEGPATISRGPETSTKWSKW